MKNLTQLPFETDADFQIAEEMARRLNRRENYSYTTGSSLIGLFCPANFDGDKGMAIIKTKELGFLVVMDCEDMGFHDLHEKQLKSYQAGK